jgi:ribosomal protein S17E
LRRATVELIEKYISVLLSQLNSNMRLVKNLERFSKSIKEIEIKFTAHW